MHSSIESCCLQQNNFFVTPSLSRRHLPDLTEELWSLRLLTVLAMPRPLSVKGYSTGCFSCRERKVKVGKPLMFDISRSMLTQYSATSAGRAVDDANAETSPVLATGI